VEDKGLSFEGKLGLCKACGPFEIRGGKTDERPQAELLPRRVHLSLASHESWFRKGGSIKKEVGLLYENLLCEESIPRSQLRPHYFAVLEFFSRAVASKGTVHFAPFSCLQNGKAEELPETAFLYPFLNSICQENIAVDSFFGISLMNLGSGSYEVCLDDLGLTEFEKEVLTLFFGPDRIT
jgi:hypothetical protein